MLIDPWMRVSTSFGFIFASLIASPVFAGHPSITLGEDWELAVDAQYRPRLVAHTGKDFVDGRSPAYVTQRARLGVSLTMPKEVSLTVRLQDVRIWGEEANTLNDFSADGFDVHEAFANIPTVGGLDLKIGRQEIVLLNSRLVGNVGWTQRARSFDAIRATWKSDILDVDAFYAKIFETDRDGDGSVPAGRTDDVDFAGFVATVKAIDGVEIHALYLFNGNLDADIYRHTMGAHIDAAFGGLSLTGEGYYQLGKHWATDIGAFLAALNVSYALDIAMKPKFTLWGEIVSGDGTPGGAFDTLYATNHKFYGEIDFFLNIPAHTKNLGLMDIGGQVFAMPIAKKLKAMASVHWFSTVEKAANDEKNLGLEIDVKVIGIINQWVQIRALYGIFLPGEAMRAVRGIPTGTDLSPEHFVYVTTDVKI